MTDSTKKTRGADASKTRAKILKAARKLFVANGFNGTSMSAIAKLAKVTQSLLHHHYGSKEALWQKVKAELLDQYFYAIEQKVERQPQHSFDKVLENRFRLMQENPDIVRMSLWQLLDNYKNHSTERGHDLLRILIDNIREAQTKDMIREDINPAMIVVVSFILTSGWFQQNYQWILDLGDDPASKDKGAADEAYLSAIQKILMEGIAKT